MDVLSGIGISGEKIVNVKLDLKDKKLLYLIGDNARTPLTKIAKKVGLSRDSVKYRINNYYKNKLIMGSRTIIDIEKLGYESYHLFLRLRNPNIEIEKKIIKEISQIPNIRSILKFYGCYDMEIALVVRDKHELDNLISNITEIIGDNLWYYEIFEIVKNYRSGQFPLSFSKDLEIKKEIRYNKKINEIKIDKKDLELIKLIKEDATLSLIEISSKIKLSPDAVSYRLKNLEVDVIKSYNYIINYKAIGYDVHALLLNINALNTIDEKNISNFFNTNENILWACKIIGKFNLIAYVCVKNTEELHNTISKIRNMFSDKINDYQTLSAHSQYKYTYAPEILFI